MIDVIIPCYNAEQTLMRAVQSALNQPELGTLWLIDDASTDNTLALAQHLQAQVPHKFVSNQCRKTAVSLKLETGGHYKAKLT
ncbi:Putative lipooligosaccharide biosynthesis protein [Actinobacillus equuli]|nr:Putative lipooligosaccharide biosynthesis protein [Actinobacillus equuli]